MGPGTNANFTGCFALRGNFVKVPVASTNANSTGCFALRGSFVKVPVAGTNANVL